MPNLCEVEYTCSMAELAIFSDDKPTVAEIKKWLRDRCAGHFSYPLPVRVCRSIICNTVDHEKVLKQAGFKKIASYKGNHRGVVKVMLYINPKNRIKK